MLEETARRLFAQRGYPDVSAGVTRGALYHHYANKQDLFRAVFEELERELSEEITAAIEAAPDQRTAMVAGIARFLDICQRPEVVRIALTDAPAVLGWQAWREIEARYGLGLIITVLDRASREGVLVPAPVPALAQLVFSAVTEAALMVANAEDRATGRRETNRGRAPLQ